MKLTTAVLCGVVVAFAFTGGRLVGYIAGSDAACKSVKAEFVKGKCVKVTREEVK